MNLGGIRKYNKVNSMFYVLRAGFVRCLLLSVEFGLEIKLNTPCLLPRGYLIMLMLWKRCFVSWYKQRQRVDQIALKIEEVVGEALNYAMGRKKSKKGRRFAKLDDLLKAKSGNCGALHNLIRLGEELNRCSNRIVQI